MTQSGPVDLVERQRNHFNQIADRYRVGRSTANHLFLKELLWATAFGDITRFRGKSIDVLEPMCGFADGMLIAQRYLSDKTNYTGYDYSDEVIKSLKEEGLSNVWQADATVYEPPEAAYDAIILFGGLHHTPDHASVIVDRCARSLKRGGLFINFEPTFGNTLFKTVREWIYNRNSLFDAVTERQFGVEELLDKFRNAGLTPVKVLFPGLVSYVLFYNPDAFPYLNIGGTRLVKMSFQMDRLFFDKAIGRLLSFATLSVWERT